MRIATILDQIDLGTIALPHFQRGFVWNREQVKGLINSLYKRFPIGSLLVWVTPSDNAPTRGSGPVSPGVVNLLLDGQQRVTSLYGIVRGKAPMFFEGDEKAFTGLYFHLDNEVFEFYAPTKMKDDPLWISVTDIMQKGAASVFSGLMPQINGSEKIGPYLTRLNAIDQIKEIELYDEKITGQDKDVDTVVEIFNRINSGGTKLSKGDLALAKICASWPEARKEMRSRIDKWHQAGYEFSLEWLLRNITAILTGDAYFSSLKDVDTPAFQKGLQEAEKRIDDVLNVISSRLGLDHDRVLGERGAIPLLTRYVSKNATKQLDQIARDKLLYWYVHTFLWGRYAGATESALAQDLGLIAGKDGLDGLIDNLRRTRGSLVISGEDVSGWSTGARFYPLLYLLTRVCGAKDWGSGVGLSAFMLGKLSALQVHHIFPKAILYEAKYDRDEVNAIANFTFQTQETNLWISKRSPEEYFEEIEAKHRGALESHWIPMDKSLWKISNYRDFLKERRALIAHAANEFLEGLLHGKVPETESVGDIASMKQEGKPLALTSDKEEELILECAIWAEQQGLPPAEIEYELSDEKGNVLAVLDLAWPEGMQPGLTRPVALVLNGAKEIEAIVNEKNFLYFSSVEGLKRYVREVIFKGTEAAEP